MPKNSLLRPSLPSFDQSNARRVDALPNLRLIRVKLLQCISNRDVRAVIESCCFGLAHTIVRKVLQRIELVTVLTLDKWKWVFFFASLADGTFGTEYAGYLVEFVMRVCITTGA